MSVTCGNTYTTFENVEANDSCVCTLLDSLAIGEESSFIDINALLSAQVNLVGLFTYNNKNYYTNSPPTVIYLSGIHSNATFYTITRLDGVGPTTTTTTSGPNTTTTTTTSGPTTCTPCLPMVPATPSGPPPFVLPTTVTVAPLFLTTTLAPDDNSLTTSLSAAAMTSSTTTPSPTPTPTTATTPNIIPPECISSCNTLNF